MPEFDHIAHPKRSSFTGPGGTAALSQGGTAADLSATGPGYVKQATLGASLTVGAIAAADLPTAIDAAKIANGTVSNTEFQFISTVTSNVQDQIDALIVGAGGVTNVTATSPLTSSGGATPNITFASQAANVFFCGPTSSSAVPAFRAIVAGDLPSLPASQIGSGQLALARGGTNADLSATGAGFLKQATPGANITVTSIVASDIASGVIDTARLGTGTPDSSVFLRGDGAWANVETDAPAVYTATDGATVTFDLNNSISQVVTLGGNRTLAVSNDIANVVFNIQLKQDATGSRTVTWWSGISWAGGAAPTLTTTANKTDWFGFRRTGSGTYHAVVIGANI